MKLYRVATTRPANDRQAGRIRLGIDLFTAAMVGSVALALAGLTWRLAGYSGELPVASPAAVSKNADPADIGGVIALAPFGTAQAAGQTTGGGAIKLKGILLAFPASASTALIAGPDGKVASYGVGAAINGGVIDAIEADQVIVRMPGGLQALAFATGGQGQALPGQPAQVQSAQGQSGQAQSMIPSGSPLGPPGRPGPTGGAPVAGLDSGGLRVSATSPPALFAAGLRPGDIVEQLNGSPVNAGSNERDLIARVTQSGSAQVLVVRNGQRLSLSLAMH